jgi:hypothetical protein
MINPQGKLGFLKLCIGAVGVLLLMMSVVQADPVELTLVTDWYGHETSFEMVNILTPSSLIASSPDPAPGSLLSNTTYVFSWILDPGTYDFTIYDDWGDGIYSPGGYVLKLNGSPVSADTRGAGAPFGHGETTRFTVPGTGVPEPSTLLLLGLGLAGVGVLRKRR